jgi:hypothetical protein
LPDFLLSQLQIQEAQAEIACYAAAAEQLQAMNLEAMPDDQFEAEMAALQADTAQQRCAQVVVQLPLLSGSGVLDPIGGADGLVSSSYSSAVL